MLECKSSMPGQEKDASLSHNRILSVLTVSSLTFFLTVALIVVLPCGESDDTTSKASLFGSHLEFISDRIVQKKYQCGAWSFLPVLMIILYVVVLYQFYQTRLQWRLYLHQKNDHDLLYISVLVLSLTGLALLVAFDHTSSHSDIHYLGVILLVVTLIYIHFLQLWSIGKARAQGAMEPPMETFYILFYIAVLVCALVFMIMIIIDSKAWAIYTEYLLFINIFIISYINLYELIWLEKSNQLTLQVEDPHVPLLSIIRKGSSCI